MIPPKEPIQQTQPDTFEQLFQQLPVDDVVHFSLNYQYWLLQQEIEKRQAWRLELVQQIEQNARTMLQYQPSSVILAALAQLQSYGVDDLDVLEAMLEQGEEWLDRTMHLLIRCEQLGLIESDYTLWCKRALEGAYDWLETMEQTPEDIPSDRQATSITEQIFLARLQEDLTGPLQEEQLAQITGTLSEHQSEVKETVPPEQSLEEIWQKSSIAEVLRSLQDDNLDEAELSRYTNAADIAMEPLTLLDPARYTGVDETDFVPLEGSLQAIAESLQTPLSEELSELQEASPVMPQFISVSKLLPPLKPDWLACYHQLWRELGTRWGQGPRSFYSHLQAMRQLR